jgi:uncharacterized protein
MRLDLSELLANVGMHHRYPVDEPPMVDEDLECSGRITGHLDFTNTGSCLLVRGRISTSLTLSCGRCLIYFTLPVACEIEEQFTLDHAAGPSARNRSSALTIVEDDENPDAGILFSGPIMDLTEMLRQHLMVAVPMQPLHSEDCRGLCPQCGADLNEGACGCTAEPGNTQLSKLGALLAQRGLTEDQAE